MGAQSRPHSASRGTRMSHFLPACAMAVPVLPGGMMACTLARALVPAGRLTTSSQAGLQRAQRAAVAVASVAAGTDHDQHAASAATELPCVGACRVDGGSWPPPTTCLPRKALTEAIPVATTPSGSPAPRPEPTSLAGRMGLWPRLLRWPRRTLGTRLAISKKRAIASPGARGSLASSGAGHPRRAALPHSQSCSSRVPGGGPSVVGCTLAHENTRLSMRGDRPAAGTAVRAPVGAHRPLGRRSPSCVYWRRQSGS